MNEEPQSIDRPESREFAIDLFSEIKDSDSLLFSSKAFRARKYLEEIQGSPLGKSRMYKDILALDYVDFFTSGFSLRKIDTHFEHLSKQEKTVLMQSVIDSLDLNLKEYSSEIKSKRFQKLKEDEEKLRQKLNREKPQKSSFAYTFGM